jgi:LAS superfamily LD-carboxypeptidase LdcB
MPGSSRHHWGTDIDLNDLVNSAFESGHGKKTYEWLSANASKYGFCQPYTFKDDKRPSGYNEEKWHWSFVPVSKLLTEFASKNLRDEMITGFQGAEVAKEIGVVEKYVLGINRQCIK